MYVQHRHIYENWESTVMKFLSMSILLWQLLCFMPPKLCNDVYIEWVSTWVFVLQSFTMQRRPTVEKDSQNCCIVLYSSQSSSRLSVVCIYCLITALGRAKQDTRRSWTDAEAVYSYRGLEERLCQIMASQVQNSCITWKWCVGWTLGLSLFGRIVRTYNCALGDWIIDWCSSRMADWFPDWWIDKMAGLQPVFKVVCLH